VLAKIEDYPPSLDQYEILINSLATSEHCPYRAIELWDMTIDEVMREKEWVDIKYSAEYARYLDEIAKTDKS